MLARLGLGGALSAARMKRILVDPARQEELYRNGYTAVRLLSADEAASLLAQLTATRLDGDFENRNGGPNSSYHASVLDPDLHYKRQVNDIVRDAFGPPLAKILDGYRVATSGFLAKPAGGGAVGLHRDWTMTASVDDICLNIWCPLVDVDDTNGTLRLLAGSHRLVPNIEAPYVPFCFQPYAVELLQRATPVPLKAGEALIFDTSILHGSRVNMSERLRPVAVSLWVPQDATLVFHRLDRTSGGTRLEQFDMEEDGYVEHTAQDFFGGTIRRRSLGFVNIQNRAVSLAEFEALLADGASIRRPVYQQVGVRSAMPAWIRSFLNRERAPRV
jgi:hypothetical protein